MLYGFGRNVFIVEPRTEPREVSRCVAKQGFFGAAHVRLSGAAASRLPRFSTSSGMTGGRCMGIITANNIVTYLRSAAYDARNFVNPQSSSRQRPRNPSHPVTPMFQGTNS
jgi:hypothetical protein